jgi:hypothetical protein
MMLVYSRQYLADRGLDKGEFYLLVLYATLGMMVMISAANFLTMYLGLELMSLSLYGLVAIDRDSPRHRGGDEVFRARRAGLRPAALWHVDDLRRHRQPRTRRRRAGAVPGKGGKDGAGLRPGVPGRRHRLQAGPGAVPHVDPRRLSRRADRGDHVHRLAPKLAAFAMAMRLLVYGCSASPSTGRRCC